MAIKFYILQVSKVKRETVDSISITFDIPDDIRDIFSYKHGQYVTIKVPVDGNENRRSYSISTSPILDKDLTITIKKVNDGVVSQYLNENIKVGDKIAVMPPLGNFTVDLDPVKSNDYLLIGGGSGITPLMSILKTILSVELTSRVHLLYQNRNEESIIFRGQLEELQHKYENRLFVTHILSRPSTEWKGKTGHLKSDFIAEFAKFMFPENIFKAHYFVCGPDGLTKSSEEAFANLHLASYQIHKEIFANVKRQPGEELDNIKLDDTESEIDITTRTVKIMLYGEEHEFEVEPDETILTAAQRDGEDPPFSCQLGACSTCRAKLVSGKVYMDAHDALTDDEIDEGYILTCQSHPLTDDVYADYDEV